MIKYKEPKILKRGESGWGTLIESDAGYIDPMEPRNQTFINEMKKLDSGKKLTIVEPLVVYVVLQKYGILNLNGRIYPEAILRKQNELYQAFIKDRSALGECVPAGTQLFSKNGWVNIEDVKTGDEIFTLNLETNNIEIQKVSSTIEKDYQDDLVHIYNDHTLNMKLTKNHKMILWDRYDQLYETTAIDFYEKMKNKDSKVSHSRIKYSGVWEGCDDEYFTLPNTDIKIKTELWAAFLGIFIAEGYTNGSRGAKKQNYRVGVCQLKEDTRKEISDLLDQLPFKFNTYDNTFLISHKELHEHLSVLGNSLEKYIPDYAKNWSPKYLNILIKWMLMGDGVNRHNLKGKLMREYYTTSKRLSEDVFEVFLKLGSGANIRTRKQIDRQITDTKTITNEVVNNDGTITKIKEKVKSKRLIKAENSSLLYIIAEKYSSSVTLDNRFTKVDLVPHNDKVYCVSTPNKTWLMRYNNQVAWTHNCEHPQDSIINSDRVSHVILETWWEGHTLMGKMEILMSPGYINLGIISCKGDQIANLLRHNIKIGVSSRGVGSLVEGRNGEQIVQDDFEIICWDVVTRPSTLNAWMGSTREELTPYVESITIKKPILKENILNKLDNFLL